MRFKELGEIYKGQAYNLLDFPGSEPIYYDLNQLEEELKIIISFLIKKLKLSGIYFHQGEAIKSLFQDKNNIVLGIEKGSGKDTICVFSTILNSMSGFKTLFLVSEKKLIQEKEKKFREDIEKIGISLTIGTAIDKESLIGHLNTLTPEILITTPEIIYELFMDLKVNYFKEYFISQLSLIIVDEFLDFPTNELLHIKYLFTFFQALSIHNIYFILTTYSTVDLKKMATFITGKPPEEIKVITNDGSPKNPFQLIFWMPEILLEHKDGELKGVRKDYNEEVVLLTAGLIGKMNKKNLLIWHAFAPLSSYEIQQIKEKITEFATGPVGFSLYVINDPKEIPKNIKFDVIILLGLPRNLKRLKNIIGNYIEKNCECIVIIPEDPFSYFISRQENFRYLEEMFPILTGTFEYSENIKNLVELNYFKLFLFHTVKLFYDFKDFEKIWGKVDKFLTEFRDFLIIEEDKIRIKTCEELKEKILFIPWGFVSEKDILLYYYHNPIFFIESPMFPFLYFPRKIIYLKGEKFIIKEINIQENKGEIDLVSKKEAVERIPVINFSKVAFTVEKEKKIKNHPWRISISYGTISFSIEMIGYQEHFDYNISGKEKQTIEISPKICKEIKSKGICIKGFALLPYSWQRFIAHELEHILKIFIPPAFPEISDKIFIFFQGISVFIIPLSEHFSSIIDILYNEIEKILNHNFISEFFLSCPCEEGCPLCLQIMNCTINGIRKKELLFSLTHKNIDFQFLILGLPSSNAQIEYQKIRNKILNLFNKHLEIEIKNPVPIQCVKKEDLGDNILGIFIPNEIIKVIENLKKRIAIEVIAHEYAHNYEDEVNVNVLKDNKIIVEGFAQWVAFKIMFFYGLIENMKAIKLREYDEYGEGFNILYWLEQKVGFYGVIEFIQTGKAKKIETGEEYDFERIQKESKISKI